MRDDKKLPTFGFSHNRPNPSLPLGHISQGFLHLSNWLSSIQQKEPSQATFAGKTLTEARPDTVGTVSVKPAEPVQKLIPDLTSLLNKPVYDVDHYGSVPDLIQNELQLGRDASFLVTDLTSVVKQYDQWVDELPMVEPFYAFKCNPDPVVARLLATLGCGFDCATMGEIKAVLHDIGPDLSFGPRGLAADKIVYANPAKMLSHLEYAVQHGVVRTTFDGADELYKLAKVNQTLPQGNKLQLLLRLATDDKDSICSFSNKFGCPAN